MLWTQTTREEMSLKFHKPEEIMGKIAMENMLMSILCKDICIIIHTKPSNPFFFLIYKQTFF
jgi:hypothetical protein